MMAIPCANRTTLGSPLVPEVKIIMNVSAAATSRCGVSGGAAVTASA